MPEPVAQANTAGASAPDADAHKPYLTFMLGGEMFALDIHGIREVIEYGGLTAVPMMPSCIRGVINLRGAVVPVMDLSARFGRARSEIGKRSCIVIVELAEEEGGGAAAQETGLLVDAVNAVLEIASAEIEPAPAFGARIRADFIEGIAKVNGRFVILLDARRVLSVAEVVALSAPARPASPAAPD
jgi:purine-binding chemotaxis protein CheW